MVFEVVQSLCEKRHVSFTAVERACDLANGTISKLRKSMISADKLKRIADYFGVSMEYLLTGEGAPEHYIDPETAELAQEIFQNSKMRILLDSARRNSPENLELLTQMAMKLEETNPDG